LPGVHTELATEMLLLSGAAAKGGREEERGMLARLGHFLYSLGSGLAWVALVGVFVLQHSPDYDYRWVVYVPSVVSAVLFWLIGRACKYFLAGE
jgi:hypothetical protein